MLGFAQTGCDGVAILPGMRGNGEIEVRAAHFELRLAGGEGLKGLLEMAFGLLQGALSLGDASQSALGPCHPSSRWTSRSRANPCRASARACIWSPCTR